MFASASYCNTSPIYLLVTCRQRHTELLVSHWLDELSVSLSNTVPYRETKSYQR